MSMLIEVGNAVRARRTDMGLSQSKLAKLSRLSRATVNALETGAINDLGLDRVSRVLGVLGLSMHVTPAHPRIRRSNQDLQADSALVLAARTASTSYHTPLPTEILKEALITCNLPKGFMPHVRSLLDEAPIDLLAAVVEELHIENNISREQIWTHMRSIAKKYKTDRELFL
jgi:transcriptional regulator with XRE-family HTH domain